MPFDLETDSYTYCFNAAYGFRHLISHSADAKPFLLDGIESDDYQQRFLCALILAWSGETDTAERVVPILAVHLRDNDIREDAKWCAYALYQLGKPAMVAIKNELELSDDAQQRELLTLLLLNIEEPPTTHMELESRKKYNHISSSAFDPTIEPPRDNWMGWLRDMHK